MSGYAVVGYALHDGAAQAFPLALGPLLVLIVGLSVGRCVAVLSAARWWRSRSNASRSSSNPPTARPGALANGTEGVLPVLASDREREEAASLVGDAIGAGRLNLDEGGQRIDAVLRSRHRRELADLVADLPSPIPTGPARPVAYAGVRLGLLATVANAVLAAVLAQAFAGLWELWPLAVLLLGALALAPRRLLRAT
jgi:hypothetical protein